MDIMPKRRRIRSNPYTLSKDEANNLFLVSFKDGFQKDITIRLTKDIFNAMDGFERDDVNELNEYDRHIYKYEKDENTLNNKIMDKPISVEEQVIRKLAFEDVLIELRKLPEIQKRRIVKYFFYKKTFEQIAKEENCTKRAVKFSVDIAIKKIRKKLSN